MQSQLKRALTAASLAIVLLCTSSVYSQSTSEVNDSLVAVPPASTRCVSYCDTFQAVELTADGSKGYARVYRNAGLSWGFVNVTLPDTRNIPVDSDIESHIHELSCDEPSAGVTNGVKINGQKFTWNMYGDASGTTTRWDNAAIEDVLVPPPEQAGSVVVHDPNGEQHLCCSLQSCEPPATHTCAAACSTDEWVILDPTSVVQVGGAAALWTDPETSGTFIVVDMQLRGQSAAVAKATLSATLHDGGAAIPGPVWTDTCAESDDNTVSVQLPPPAMEDGPRLRTRVMDATAPTVTAEGKLALVLSGADGTPLASCALSACSFPPGGAIDEVLTADTVATGANPTVTGYGDSSSSSEDSVPLAAIVAGAVGGFVVLGALVITAVVLLRKDKQRQQYSRQESRFPPPSDGYPSSHAPSMMWPGAAAPPGSFMGPVDPKYGGSWLGGPLSVHSGDSFFRRSDDSCPRPYSPGAASGVHTQPNTLSTNVSLNRQAKGAQLTDASSVAGGRELLEETLDDMRTQGKPFAGRYTILGSFERRAGGQGLVQFVRDMDTAKGYAVKFFFDRKAFAREEALYNDPELRSMMAATRHVSTNDDATALYGPSGYRFPQYILIERGEPLDEWIKRMLKRSSDGLIETIDVCKALINIAERLSALREAGYVHRDIKPSNVLWLQDMHAWTLIDFGSTVAAGLEERLQFTLAYAAPEVAAAHQNGHSTHVADPATDVWALGVIAFEMLTGEPVFAPFTEYKTVNDSLLGHHPLPWEGPRRAELLKKLRVFRVNVLECLHRDPRQRPPISSVVKGWESLFKAETTAM